MMCGQLRLQAIVQKVPKLGSADNTSTEENKPGIIVEELDSNGFVKDIPELTAMDSGTDEGLNDCGCENQEGEVPNEGLLTSKTLREEKMGSCPSLVHCHVGDRGIHKPADAQSFASEEKSSLLDQNVQKVRASTRCGIAQWSIAFAWVLLLFNR
jgi:hypothetical protein